MMLHRGEKALFTYHSCSFSRRKKAAETVLAEDSNRIV
jgi:hypothetical protein